MAQVNTKRKPMVPEDWHYRLEPQSKAEILGTVLHILEHNRHFKKMPKWYRELVRHAQRDCSIQMTDLDNEDIRDIKDWLRTFDPKGHDSHGRPKKPV